MLMSNGKRLFGVNKSDHKSDKRHRLQTDVVRKCMYIKLTFAAELKVVLEPEFLSPADNRPQIRDVAILL